MCRLVVKGYMTIEMTLIMPVVLFVLTFAISLTYMEYDRCIIDEDLRIGVARYSNISGFRTDYRPEDAVNSKSLYWSGDELVSMNGETPMFSGSLLSVSASADGELRNPLAGFFSQMGLEKHFSVHSSWETQRYRPAQFLWKCRKVEKLGKKLHN